MALSIGQVMYLLNDASGVCSLYIGVTGPAVSSKIRRPKVKVG